MEDRMVRTREFEQLSGYERTTLWRKERQDPNFPKRYKIGKRATAYKMSEIQAWLEGLPLASKTNEAA